MSPNVVPKRPSFHRILNQQVVLEEKHYLVSLEVEREGFGTEIVEFKVPLEICRNEFTIFELGLHVETGWTLFYTEEKEVTRLKTEVATIPSL